MEKREVIRDSVLRAGTIQFGAASINCMVRDRSNAGAMLNVPSSVGIPEHFTLILSPDGHHMACHVVWRKEKRIGVAFE
jgi:PilZ domain